MFGFPRDRQTSRVSVIEWGRAMVGLMDIRLVIVAAGVGLFLLAVGIDSQANLAAAADYSAPQSPAEVVVPWLGDDAAAATYLDYSQETFERFRYTPVTHAALTGHHLTGHHFFAGVGE